MRIRIPQKTFSDVLTRAQAILDRKSPRPILEHVLLEAFEGSVRVSTTDLRVSLTQRVGAEIDQPGSVALPGRKLHEIIREMPKGDVVLEMKENRWVTLTAGKGEFHLPGSDPDEFPTMPSPPDRFLQLGTASFRTMLEKTLFASSNDESRMYLCGVYIRSLQNDAGEPVLRMVATDGHRLNLIDRPVDTEIDIFRDGMILPKKGLSELRSLLETEDDQFDIASGDGKVFTRFDGVDMALTLIDGTFPNYEQVVPPVSPNPLVVPREEFIQGLRRVSLLSDQDTHSVILEATGDEAIITAMNPMFGDAREVIEAPHDGEPIRIAFNAAYFLEALKSLDGEKVLVSVGESLAPCLVQSEADPRYLCVVMPMRID